MKEAIGFPKFIELMFTTTPAQLSMIVGYAQDTDLAIVLLWAIKDMTDQNKVLDTA